MSSAPPEPQQPHIDTFGERPGDDWRGMPWNEVADHVACAAQDVQLWLFSLDSPVLGQARLEAMLDEHERSRAARFVFDRDRRRFVAAHGMLRALLACHCGASPSELRFGTMDGGKPFLTGPPQASRVHFSLSHSQDFALVGITRLAPLGVDLELVRDVPEWKDIARTNFAPSEVNACLALPPSVQRDAFFATWARKEAFVKAGGEGLAMPLDDFEVEVQASSAGTVLRSIRGDVQAARQWTLRAWRLDPLMEAAVAIPASKVTVASHILGDEHRV
jgi:4'-phosphopantetheinyl transferase